jgi:integrase
MDINFKPGTLQVRRAIRRMKGKGFVESDPKSKQSRRGLTIAPEAVAALEQHCERQTFARKAAGPAWTDHGYVFANSVGGPLEPGNLMRRSFWPRLDRAGLPRTLRFRDIRHTVASLMLKLDEKVIQGQLGHAGIATTANVYSHLSAKKKRDAALRLGSLLAANG